MEKSTDFRGPVSDDYENVAALNAAFMCSYTDLKGPQRGRLSSAPFLLFSLRESDLDWWIDALADRPQGDLLAAGQDEHPIDQHLQLAALSFLWQLSRRDPYVARIVAGASIAWCELIAALPLIVVLDKVGGRTDLMVSRLQMQGTRFERLLEDGIDARVAIQNASKLAALHRLLTRIGEDTANRMSAAACRMNRPLRVLGKKL